MKWTKGRVVLILFFAVILIVLIVRKNEINTALNYFLESGEEEYSYPIQDEDQVAVPLGEGSVFSQIVVPEKRMSQIGIRMATYMRTNTSEYEFEVYTSSGLLIGKSTIYAETLVDNEYQWFSLSRDTIAGEEYEIRITANEVPANNEIAIYTAFKENSQYTINGNTSEGTIVVAYRYVIEKDYMIWIFSSYLILFVLIFFWKVWTERIQRAWKVGKGLLGHKKLILYIGIIICGCVGCIVSLFHTRTDYQVVYHSTDGSNMEVIPMENGAEYRQEIVESEVEWEQIGIRLATYTQTYSSGEMTVSFYDGDSLLREITESAETIEDNQYFYVDFQSDPDYDNLNIALRIELPEGQNCGIYYTQTGNMDYELLHTEKEIDWLSLSVWAGITAIGGGLLLASKKSSWRKWLGLIGTLSVGAICGVLVYTYSVFGDMTPDSIRKCLGMVKKSETILEYNDIECANMRSEEQIYYLGGGSATSDIHYTSSYINTKIDSITLTVDPGSIPYRQQIIGVYYDLGNGFGEEGKDSYQIIYKGETQITIPFSYSNLVRRIRIDFGNDSSLFDGIPFQILGMKFNSEIIFSDNTLIFMMIIGMIIGGIVWIWKEFNIEEKIRKERIKIHIRHEVVFVILSFAIGVIMSIIIPILQTPDEQNHMNMALGVGEVIAEEAAESITGVSEYAGISVNTDQYKKLLFKAQPDDMKLQITIRNIVYPGQTLGAIIAYSLNLPVFWIATFAEIGALIVYTVIGYFAIKKMPFNKTLIMAVLLMPMMMQQAGSWSYDSLNNAVCVYLIAYIFYLRDKDLDIGWKQIIWLFICGGVLLYIKKVYVVFLLLLAIIPLRKFVFRIGKKTVRLTELLKMRIFWGISAVILLGIAVFMIYVLRSQEAGRLLLEYIQAPENLVLVIGKTIQERVNYWYNGLLAEFGWSDLTMPSLYYFLISVLLIYLSISCVDKQQNVKRTVGWERLVISGIIILSITLICASMLSWTLSVEGIDSMSAKDLIYFNLIEGVQGRYFLPLIPLVLLLPRNNLFKKTYRSLILAAYFLVVPAWALVMLYARYWN